MARNTRHFLGLRVLGKTFTMANIIAKTQRPTLVLAHNKTLARTTIFRIQRVFSRKQSWILCVILWLLPTRKLHSSLRHIHWKRCINKWRNRQTPSFSHIITIWNKRRNSSSISIMYIRFRWPRRLPRNDAIFKTNYGKIKRWSNEKASYNAIFKKWNRFQKRNI